MKKTILFLVAIPLIIAFTVAVPLPLGACTLWGAAGEIAAGGTIISKNRDWRPDHVQVLKVRRAENSYAYFGLFAEGNDATGLKQGVNEKGLAVITATAGSIPRATRDAQKGRSGLMGTLLAKYANCDEILADQEAVFANRKPHFLMASDGKKILMLEVGLDGKYAVKVVESGTVVHSNHYLEDSMTEFNISTGTSSLTRVKRIAHLLESAPKPLGAETFAAFSRDQNDGPANSLWRTGSSSTSSCTLSSWIVETPANGIPRVRAVVANPGQPEEIHQFVLDDAFWKNPPAPSPFQATPSEGRYPGHLQGICTNERDAIYWSWTDTLVKTDLHGRVMKRVPVASHHGDLTWHDGKIYVAVNLGKFNQPPGQADSWVYVYDAETLVELARHPVPELVHGAGGMAYHDGKFILVGGLPPGTGENYLYEYDTQLKFRQRHVLPSGYTLMGIQTAAYFNGSWWFGCYGKPATVLRTDEAFQLQGKWDFDAALGIVGIGDGKFLIGQNTGNKRSGYTGRAVAARADKSKGLVILPAASKPGIQMDANFPGGNILLEEIKGDTVTLRQDPRDTEGWWFYWYFRVTGAAGRTLAFNFTDGAPIGVRGPAVSLDGGRTWDWLGTTNKSSFTYSFPEDVHVVRFSFGMPYTQENLETFLHRNGTNEALRVETLCQSRKSRPVEKLRLGKLDGDPRFRVLLTARSHACEMMASYAVEGIMESALAKDPLGEWFRENVEFLVIPFVDKDGVEDGDQGKKRRPRDHNRDYDANSLYPETRTIQALVPKWSNGKLRVTLDMHCPYIRGNYNEYIYQVGSGTPAIWKEQQRFGALLEKLQTGPLVYSVTNSLEFGTAWNKGSNFSAGMSGTGWAVGLSGVKLASTFELPYANASGQPVTAESARAFGHDIARALRAYLEGK